MWNFINIYRNILAGKKNHTLKPETMTLNKTPEEASFSIHTVKF